MWNGMMIAVICLAVSAKGTEDIKTKDLNKEIATTLDENNFIPNYNKEDEYSKLDQKNAEDIEGYAKEVEDIENDPPRPRGWKVPKVCLDKRGDCKSVLQYCPTLRGLCDKSCGYCKGLLGHKETFVFGLEEITLSKGNLIARIPFIGREYSVTFDLLPTMFGTGTRSVLHFSVSNRDNSINGDRMPALWFHSIAPSALKNRMHICADVSGNRNHCYNTNTFFEKNKWVQISISQKHVFGGYYYSISVDGHAIYTLRNTRPATYRKVFVYGGDPWYNTNEGRIKNLVIKTSE